MFQSKDCRKSGHHFSTMKVLIQSKILTVVLKSQSCSKNQEKFLKEEAAFSSGINLMETPNVNTDPKLLEHFGFSGDAFDAGPAGFDPVLISLIRRVFLTWSP